MAPPCPWWSYGWSGGLSEVHLWGVLLRVIITCLLGVAGRGSPDDPLAESSSTSMPSRVKSHSSGSSEEKSLAIDTETTSDTIILTSVSSGITPNKTLIKLLKKDEDRLVTLLTLTGHMFLLFDQHFTCRRCAVVNGTQSLALGDSTAIAKATSPSHTKTGPNSNQVNLN